MMRIKSATPAGPGTIRVEWAAGGDAVDIDLTGWIATGGDALAAIGDPETFKTAMVVDHGSAVQWTGDDDLLIDATHLELLAVQQRK